jgi:hypothetical protein
MREHREQTIEFSVVETVLPGSRTPATSCTGVVVDVSASGIGFLTDLRLRPGNRITFSMTDVPHVGVVMWTLQTEKMFRVGVRFTETNGGSS